jgi:hypothetical protein
MTEPRTCGPILPEYAPGMKRCPLLGVYCSEYSSKSFAVCVATGEVVSEGRYGFAETSRRPCDATVEQIQRVTDQMIYDSHTAQEMFLRPGEGAKP